VRPLPLITRPKTANVRAHILLTGCGLPGLHRALANPGRQLMPSRCDGDAIVYAILVAVSSWAGSSVADRRANLPVAGTSGARVEADRRPSWRSGFGVVLFVRGSHSSSTSPTYRTPWRWRQLRAVINRRDPASRPIRAHCRRRDRSGAPAWHWSTSPCSPLALFGVGGTTGDRAGFHTPPRARGPPSQWSPPVCRHRRRHLTTKCVPPPRYAAVVSSLLLLVAWAPPRLVDAGCDWAW